jgi:hypothetical protein
MEYDAGLHARQREQRQGNPVFLRNVDVLRFRDFGLLHSSIAHQLRLLKKRQHTCLTDDGVDMRDMVCANYPPTALTAGRLRNATSGFAVLPRLF